MSLIPVRQYNGNQVILTSGRLVFNAKEDNIIMSTKNDVALSIGGSMHVNIGPSSGADPSKNFYILNAPRIQMGLGNAQPVPKGDDLFKALNELCSSLSQLANNLSGATGIGVGTVAQPSINAAGTLLAGQVSNVQSLLKKVNSTITFTT